MDGLKKPCKEGWCFFFKSWISEANFAGAEDEASQANVDFCIDAAAFCFKDDVDSGHTFDECLVEKLSWEF